MPITGPELSTLPMISPARIRPRLSQNRDGSRSFNHHTDTSAESGRLSENSSVWVITLSCSRVR